MALLPKFASTGSFFEATVTPTNRNQSGERH
jgi:hypothetical protein